MVRAGQETTVTLANRLPLRFERPDAERSFPLLRYYIIASIIVVALATLVVDYTFSNIQFRKLVEVTERRALQEADHLNTILSYQPALQELDKPGLTLQRLSDVRVMDSFALNPSIPSNIALFSILDPTRRVVYSTFPPFRHQTDKEHPGFDSAMIKRQVAGDIVDMPTDKDASWWPPTQQARELPAEIGRSVKLVEIYRPIYAQLDEGEPPIGVLKTYHYLKEPGVASVLGIPHSRSITKIITMGALFLILVGIIGRGQGVINRSQAQVAVRTQELSRTNEELAREIDRHEQAEARLERRSIELAAVNKELESFSYSVSHDLRAPLRSVDGFGQALLEDYSELLDAQGKDYIQRMRAASQRMGESIDGLLKLSRVTRSEIRRERVDLSALVQAVAAELQATQPLRRAEFVIQEGIIANGDAQLLRVVLDNLLSNAWKFTGSREVSKIEFGVTPDESGSAYFVRDNGVGFDMAYVDKLFGAFQRLHAVTEFEGMGIGLATVKRIVHRHGGQVWTEGETGVGATFYFTLN